MATRTVAAAAAAAGASPQRQLRYMPASQLLRLRGAPGIAIIDVRNEDERVCDGHIAGSIHYESGTFEDRLPQLVQDLKDHKTVVFHCALSQVRGPTCAKTFMRHLETGTGQAPEIYVLEKGFVGWSNFGLPFCSCKDIKCLTPQEHGL